MFGKKKDKIKDEDIYSVSKNVEDIFISNAESDELVTASGETDGLVSKSKDKELVNLKETDGLMTKKTEDSDGLMSKKTKVLETTDGEPLMVKVSGEVKDASDGIDLKSLSKNQLREYRRTGKIN